MTRLFFLLLRRDLGRLMPGRGGSFLPILFFLTVAMLFPFAVGPDGALLRRTGGGVVWVAALLAAILPLDRLVASDLDAGVFDQFALRGIAEELTLAVRMVAHWLTFAPFLLLAAVPASALLGLDGPAPRLVVLGLLAGTPGLAAIGVTIAALTAGLRGGTALAGLMLVPLATPILIFGAGALARQDQAALALCAAVSLALVAGAPFAAAAAIRAVRDG